MAPMPVARKRSVDESKSSSLLEGASGRPSTKKAKCIKKQWTKEEDAVLLSVVTRYLEHHGWDRRIEWPTVASEVADAGVTGRDLKSCRLRWINKLSGRTLDVKCHPFTPQEDTFVREAYAAWSKRDGLGKVVSTPWSTIASCLPGRSENDPKNRWNTHLSKRAGQVPGGPPRGGMTIEEVLKEFAIIENMLDLVKANAAKYKVVHVAAHGQAPAPPTPPPSHGQLALPALAASTAPMAAATAPVPIATAPMAVATAPMAAATAPLAQPESVFDPDSLLDIPDDVPAHGQAPPPPTQPPSQLAVPTLAAATAPMAAATAPMTAAAAPKTPAPPESSFDADTYLTFPEDADLEELPPADEMKFQRFMADVGLLASDDGTTAAPQPPPPISEEEMRLLMDAVVSRADPFVAQRTNFDFVPLVGRVL